MIFLSIISHNHDQMIIENTNLASIASHFPTTIKSNTPASNKLIRYAEQKNITLLNKDHYLGFGENNNYIFNYLVEAQKISNQDYFLVINPDVDISLASMKQLEESINLNQSDIYTINLFSDQAFSITEPSIKKFPKLINPILALLTKKRIDSYDKNSITAPTSIEWAAGSFLLFKKSCYEELKGFNSKFFMYFEDVDICKRANEKKMILTYLPSIRAMHIGAFNNRNILSKHFRWYLSSYLRYHFKQLLRASKY